MDRRSRGEGRRRSSRRGRKQKRTSKPSFDPSALAYVAVPLVVVLALGTVLTGKSSDGGVVTGEFKNKVGKTCSSGWGSSGTSEICGYGASCQSMDGKGVCVEDFSSPAGILRDVADQGHCDYAPAIFAAHMYDDIHAVVTGSQRAQPTSIMHLRDCTAFNQYSSIGCDGFNLTDVKRQLNLGVKFSKSESFESKVNDCKSGSNRVNVGMLNSIEEECYRDFESVKQKLRADGPFIHHLKVFPAMYTYPLVFKSGVPARRQYATEEVSMLDNEHIDEWNPEGYATFEIAGYGTEGPKEYLVVKTAWGRNYGKNGYMHISESLFSKLRPKCTFGDYKQDVGKYNFGNEDLIAGSGKLPAIRAKHPRFQHLNLPKIVKSNIKDLEERRQNRFVRHVSKIESKAETSKDENVDFPKLRYAKKAVLHSLNKILPDYKESKKEYKFLTKDVEVLYADLSIVSGRRINMVLRASRLNKKTNNVDEYFFRAVVWIPLKGSSLSSSDAKTIKIHYLTDEYNNHIGKTGYDKNAKSISADERYALIELEELDLKGTKKKVLKSNTESIKEEGSSLGLYVALIGASVVGFIIYSEAD